MSPTPLRLEHYFFTRVHLEANPEYVVAEGGAPAQEDIDVGIRIEVLRHDEDPHRYQLTLTINKVTAREGRVPYNLDIQVVGLFSIDPDFKHDNIDRLVQVNGASMLFTATREHVLMVTGRGPWGPFQLPTVNFHWAISQAEKKTDTPPDVEQQE